MLILGASFFSRDGRIPITAPSSGTAIAAAHQYFFAASARLVLGPAGAGLGFKLDCASAPMRGIIPPQAELAQAHRRANRIDNSSQTNFQQQPRWRPAD